MSLPDLFQSRVPIIQAPMAGGINTPELAAAVAEAGAIGSFGFAYSTAEAIDRDLAATRQLTRRPINANFFVFSETESPSLAETEAAIAALEALPISVSGEFSVPLPPYFPDLETQLEPVWKHCPELLTFHFGVPQQALIDKAKSLGMLVGITATSVDEALLIDRAGADFIVAQGIEAGGHRGTFSANPSGDQQLSTTALIMELSAATDLPLVGAGGIMTGAAIRQTIDSGATAVQMGTAFLCCDEAGTNAVYRNYLSEQQARPTVFTRGFSGRRAQAIENEFTRSMAGQALLPFPLQNTLTGSLRQSAVKAENGEYQSFWAGQSFAEIRSMPAAQLIDQLISEMA